jgi:CheY-like chemotaxis protein/nitrogen-specific signal transduction histidine kinase/HPt (histidine-containing phosphotransfer) domain-containing protein
VGFRADITELVRATDAAQAASLAKSRFLANMSHEIRTPMNAILGLLTLLRKTALNERQTDYAAKTESASRSLLGLLNDILDFSMAEAGKMALDVQPFATESLLRDLAVIASASVGAKPIELLFDVDPQVPARLAGDAMRLQQVLVNLLGNAIKFTDTGAVVLSIAVVARTPESATLEIAVRDSGIGIAAENHDRIFGGFTQAEASTTRRFGGTGLGVTICQRLVALMGGELRLESALGEGSRFHFRIELGVPDDEVIDTPATAVTPLRVLVADDHDEARELLARMAGSLGWTVEVAADGDDALARVRARVASGAAFDAVLLDADMVGLGGVDTGRRIGADPVAFGTPLCLLMASMHDHDRVAQPGRARVRAAAPAPVATPTAQAWSPEPAHASPSARLSGLRLLLVEDNLNNQQVARELLEDEGASVVIAGHGQEALDLLARTPDRFDVVLMDIQMPVMDGLTAARRIRDDLGLADLPIVAMTANAMASDRDDCLAAGMNDHVGKPFDIDVLVARLRRHTGRADAAAAPAACADLSRETTLAAIAADVDIAAAMQRLDGKRDVYRRLLASFVDDLSRWPAQLRSGCADAGPEATLRRLHSLKGLAATLGATSLSASAAAEEKRIPAEGPGASFAAAIERVCRAIDAGRPALAALLRSLPTASPSRASTAATARPDDAAVRASLERIADHLRHADMAAIDAMDDLLQRLGDAPGPGLDALQTAVAALDFERALTLCHALLDESAAVA